MPAVPSPSVSPDMRNRSRRAVTVALAATLGGCAVLTGPSRKSMDIIRDDRGCSLTLAPDVLVFLPGANMAPIELVEQGFVDAVRRRKLAVDLALPDANMGYVYDGSMMRRLEDDVVGPAIAQGRRRVWLAGISLGGYVALVYAMRKPEQIAGVLAIAPYLGRRELLKDIADAGGPAAWRRHARPRASKDGAEDLDHAVWMWLSDPQRETSLRGPPLWLAYGGEDRLAEGHRLLDGILERDRVSTAPGGHDWPPWRTLWAQWLDRGVLPRESASCPHG